MNDLYQPINCQWLKVIVPKSKVKYYEDSPGYYLISKSSEGSAVFAFRKPSNEPLPHHLAVCSPQEVTRLESIRSSVQGLKN